MARDHPKHATANIWLKLLTAVAGLVAAILAVVAGYQTVKKGEVADQNTHLSNSLGAAQSTAHAASNSLEGAHRSILALASSNHSLEAALSSANSRIATLPAPPGAVGTGPTSTAPHQLLGVDITKVGSGGNEWGEGNSDRIGKVTYDDVVDMGWCSECLDSSTTDGYVEYDIGGQYKYLDVAIGQLGKSPDSTGVFRFDIKLDDKIAKSYTLGLYTPVVLKNFPIANAERITFAVRNLGKGVNAFTGFGDPTVHN